MYFFLYANVLKNVPLCRVKDRFASYFLRCTSKSEKLVLYFNSILTLNIGIASFSLYKTVSC